jgi:hypothetical protein
MAATSINFRRSAGPCNLSCISTVSSVDVAFSKVTFAHLVTGAAPLAPLISAAAFLAVAGAVVYAFDRSNWGPYVCAGLFVLRWIVWYFFRNCEATFGASGVDCNQTRVSFSASDQDQLRDAYLANCYDASSASSPGSHPGAAQNNLQTWAHSYKKFMCIPAGEDTVVLGDKHIQVQKNNGMCCMKEKDHLAIMTKNVKWLHFASSGRDCLKLVLVLICLGVLTGLISYIPGNPLKLSDDQSWEIGGAGLAIFLVYFLYWLGNTSHTLDFSYLGAPPGGTYPGAPAIYDGTWQTIIPTEGLTGGNARDEMMVRRRIKQLTLHTIFRLNPSVVLCEHSTQCSPACLAKSVRRQARCTSGRARVATRHRRACNYTAISSVRRERSLPATPPLSAFCCLAADLTDHRPVVTHAVLNKTASGCCGRTDTYVMLLKDIQHLETYVGVNKYVHQACSSSLPLCPPPPLYFLSRLLLLSLAAQSWSLH